MTSVTTGYCARCEEHFSYLVPLHGDKGGPPCCLTCIGTWTAEHGRKRNAGRVAIRAMKNFLDAGGAYTDIERLRVTVTGSAFGLSLDPLGYLHGVADTQDEVIELTLELLSDVLTLVHPDHQPAERKELATSVTARLLAIKPFVFPELKKPEKTRTQEDRTQEDRNTSITSQAEPNKDVLQYPCPTCRSTIPFLYCDACKAEWDRRHAEERARENAKLREKYAAKRQRRLRSALPKRCAACGRLMAKERRKHIKYCSAACRIKAHRKR